MSKVDFCAECLASFIKDQNASSEPLPENISLGFTFSYPVFRTVSITVYFKVDQRFWCPNVEGKDVAQLFRESLTKFVGYFALIE